MNTKYTVEIDDNSLFFEVVEWDRIGQDRVGTVVGKYREESIANADCDILNRGYEYEMSAICATEFDEVTV